MKELELSDGKYKVILHDNYTMEALRHGEPWRELTGDNLVYSMLAKIIDLQADNLRLSDLVTKFDTALRTIATEAGMEEAFTGIDCDPEYKPLVEHVANLRKALEASNQLIWNGGFGKP